MENSFRVYFKVFETELQKVVKEDDVYKIEKIFKKREKGENVKYLVK